MKKLRSAEAFKTIQFSPDRRDSGDVDAIHELWYRVSVSNQRIQLRATEVCR
jgi:hypothetical protein